MAATSLQQKEAQLQEADAKLRKSLQRLFNEPRALQDRMPPQLTNAYRRSLFMKDQCARTRFLHLEKSIPAEQWVQELVRSLEGVVETGVLGGQEEEGAVRDQPRDEDGSPTTATTTTTTNNNNNNHHRDVVLDVGEVGLFALKSTIEILLFFGAVSTRCSHESYPTLTAGTQYEFFWTGLSGRRAGSRVRGW